jgi:chemotaxis signal transduction protein
MHDLFKKLLARSSAAIATHYVVVGVGTETFGLPAHQIQEIIGLGDMKPMPRLPKRLAGPVRLADRMIFLVRMQASFARAQGESEVGTQTCVLVLRAHSAISSKVPKGVVVDRVDRIIALDEDDIETIATRRRGFWSTCTLGFVRHHLPLVLLDLENLVSESPTSALKPAPNAETATSRLKRKREEADQEDL